MLDTAMWHDIWFMDLEPLEQLLFIYLIANEHTTIAGVYQISLRSIEFETKIPKDQILQMFEKMKDKVFYKDGWIVMRNGIKNNNYHSPKIKTGIEIALKAVPVEIKQQIAWPKDYGEKPKEDNQTELLVDDVDGFEQTNKRRFMPQNRKKTVVKNDNIGVVKNDNTLPPLKYGMDRVSHSNSNAVANSNSNSKAPDKPSQPAGGDLKKEKGFDKRAYAIAVKRDQELALKEAGARSRTGGSTKSINQLFSSKPKEAT